MKLKTKLRGHRFANMVSFTVHYCRGEREFFPRGFWGVNAKCDREVRLRSPSGRALYPKRRRRVKEKEDGEEREGEGEGGGGGERRKQRGKAHKRKGGQEAWKQEGETQEGEGEEDEEGERGAKERRKHGRKEEERRGKRRQRELAFFFFKPQLCQGE